MFEVQFRTLRETLLFKHALVGQWDNKSVSFLCTTRYLQ